MFTGASITLQDQNWAKAVEVCLGGLLHAFCVHNHHDERELEKIMCQVVPQNARKPTVITSAHQVGFDQVIKIYSDLYLCSLITIFIIRINCKSSCCFGKP